WGGGVACGFGRDHSQGVSAGGERSGGGKAPATVTVKCGSAKQDRAVVYGNNRIRRGGPRHRRKGFVRRCSAGDRACDTAGVIGDRTDRRRRWWRGVYDDLKTV